MLFQDAQDLAAKIQLIEARPELAEEYRRGGPERIREAYTWERIADQYEELFYQLAAGQDPTLVHSSVAGCPAQEQLAVTREHGLSKLP